MPTQRKSIRKNKNKSKSKNIKLLSHSKRKISKTMRGGASGVKLLKQKKPNMKPLYEMKPPGEYGSPKTDEGPNIRPNVKYLATEFSSKPSVFVSNRRLVPFSTPTGESSREYIEEKFQSLITPNKQNKNIRNARVIEAQTFANAAAQQRQEQLSTGLGMLSKKNKQYSLTQQ